MISDSGRLVVTEVDLTGREINYAPPRIASIEPVMVSDQGGAEVIIQGRNFAPESVVVISREIIEARILDTQTISFESPALPSGQATLTVQHRGGVAQTALLVEAIPFEELTPGEITTIAGGSTFVGDGSEAVLVPLSAPHASALDSSGNLYVADTFNNRVRKIDLTTGIALTVAGNGRSGFEGDGKLAIASAISSPFGLAVDRSGNLFIADTDNQRVRKVDSTSGIIATVAGTGTAGFSGDGGPATEAQLYWPYGLAVDAAGNLFIANAGDVFSGGEGDQSRISRVEAGTGIITTVAGSGDPVFRETVARR